jgi:CHAT domain-containing protein
MRDPFSSALLLAKTAKDNGRLELREVLALTYIPSLVALSACDTQGIPHHGSFVGLSQAFLGAGARSVVSTLGRVSDLVSAIVMKQFFRHLRSHGASDSLRHATLWARERFSHPAHWATFAVVGDYR